MERDKHIQSIHSIFEKLFCFVLYYILLLFSLIWIFLLKRYAKIIISELALPPEEKTIEPVDIGGVAGGTYVHSKSF
jgi:hypothetical protein